MESAQPPSMSAYVYGLLSGPKTLRTPARSLHHVEGLQTTFEQGRNEIERRARDACRVRICARQSDDRLVLHRAAALKVLRHGLLVAGDGPRGWDDNPCRWIATVCTGQRHALGGQPTRCQSLRRALSGRPGSYRAA
jgi:hypothetical protein